MHLESRRKMDAYVWDRMPDTTNAEEAIHWKLYCAVGRDQHLIEGLYGLKAVSEYYQRMMTACIGEISYKLFAQNWIYLTQTLFVLQLVYPFIMAGLSLGKL